MDKSLRKILIALLILHSLYERSKCTSNETQPCSSVGSGDCNIQEEGTGNSTDDVMTSNQVDVDEDGIDDSSDVCTESPRQSIEPSTCNICTGTSMVPMLTTQNNFEDIDNDFIANRCDNCIHVHNPDQEDQDRDGVGDVCDRCEGHDDQMDFDRDGIPDACDPNPFDFRRSVEDTGNQNSFQMTVSPNKLMEGSGVTRVCVEVYDLPTPSCYKIITESQTAVVSEDFELLLIHGGYVNCSSDYFCMNLTIYDDQTLELNETLNVTMILTSSLPPQRRYSVELEIYDNERAVLVGLEHQVYNVSEGSAVSICATIINATSICAVEFPFNILVNTSSGIFQEETIEFSTCESTSCKDIHIEKNGLAEETRSVKVRLERTESLDDRIMLEDKYYTLNILNTDDMIIGFTSTTFTGTESGRLVEVCVEIQNAPNGAIEPLTVLILPVQGVSDEQYRLECRLELMFQEGNSIEECYNYTINPDNICEVGLNTTIFNLELGLTSNVGVIFNSSSSITNVTIDDTREPECFVTISYEETSYTVSNNSTVCITSKTLPGIEENFTATAVISESPAVTQNVWSFNFSLTDSNPTQKECFIVPLNYGFDGVCEYFNCEDRELMAYILILDETARVNNNSQSNTTLILGVPDRCECGSTNSIPSATAAPVEVIAAVSVTASVLIIGIVVLLVALSFYYNKYIKNKKKIGLPTIQLKNANMQSLLPPQLREQLMKQGMIFSKREVHLSTTVGHGESGLVYKGYLNTAIGREMVAVKTVKALFSHSDTQKITHEISTMLSFKHPNVMSLIGVCVEGDVPLLIMPFMSNGSVLEFVRKHKEDLFLTIDPNVTLDNAKVELSRVRLMNISHQISKGMEYLMVEKFVHRDLAARNCMIDHKGVIKVADFGLTEDMYAANYFRQKRAKDGEERVPIRWMAPESIEHSIYNEATDVWSFGVTVWEVFTCGKVPYPCVPVTSILENLHDGHKLQRPDNEACSNEIYEIMLECWCLEPNRRPKFKEIVEKISLMLEKESGYLKLCREGLEDTLYPEVTSERVIPLMTDIAGCEAENSV